MLKVYDKPEIEAFVRLNGDRLDQTKANVVRTVEPKIIMLKPGKKIPKPRKPRSEPKPKDEERKAPVTIIVGKGEFIRKAKPLQASDKQAEALKRAKDKKAKRDEFVSAESLKFRKASEAKRIGAVKEGKAKADKTRAVYADTAVNGRSAKVKKVLTTSDKMMNAGTLPKRLKSALDAFAVLVADGYGVATLDGHDSTNRLTGSYDVTGGGFGSKTLADRQLDGLTAYRRMRERVPVEMMETFEQIVSEETGSEKAKKRTLKQIGEDLGLKSEKQQTAIGNALVYCTCSLIGLFMRERGLDLA